MPRENFPEIIDNKIFISAVYPGNTAEDIEKLIVDPLEERLNNVSNKVKMKSTSQQDYGIIEIEFDEAKVKPTVFNLSISEETPILNINISGNYPVEKLKEYGEYLEDNIEDLKEIKQVDIRGAEEREVEVAVDIYKMMAAKVSFDDVLNSIRRGNVTVSAGNIIGSGQQRTMRILGEIKKPSDLKDFVVKTQGKKEKVL